MTRAGLGDCVARFISYGDWYLAHQLGLVDRYSETPLALMGADLDETYLEHAPLVADGTAGRAGLPGPAGAAGGTGPIDRADLDAALRHRARRLARPRHGLRRLGPPDGAPRRPGRDRHAAGRPRLRAPARALRSRPCPAHATAPRGRRDVDPARPSGHSTRAVGWPPSAGATTRRSWRSGRPPGPRSTPCASAGTTSSRHGCASWCGPRPRSARSCVGPSTPCSFEDLDPPIPPEQARFALANAHLIRERFVIGDLLWWLGLTGTSLADDLLASA